ncbi:MAG: beta-glucosidase [Clostridiales bacterium]|nr:beta-glucosidase [Clostridiales bacterium]
MNSNKNKSICESAVAEGFVLLENDGTLPLMKNDRVAVFGRAQFEYIKSGSGSGGLVVCPYVTNIGDELIKLVNIDARTENYYREHIGAYPYDNGDNWEIPQSQKEASLDESFVKTLSEDNDKAIIVISRMCGESFDLKPEKGGYYLTDEEENTIKLVCRYFKRVCVLLNVGNIIDMRWVKKYNVGTVAYVWQGGQDGGSGVAKTLVGKYYPSGRLADTIAENLSDYPAADRFGRKEKNIHTEDIYVGYRYFETFAKDTVLYPFGYGLSYTKFAYTDIKAKKADDKTVIQVTVKNTGNYFGKDVVQCYVEKPQGELGKPARELVAFKKTKPLKPCESETVTMEIEIDALASYDDGGKSGFANCYVLEKGEYGFYVGSDVRTAKKVFAFCLPETSCVKKCRQAAAPVEKFERITTKDGVTPIYEQTPLAAYDIKSRIDSELPPTIEITGEKSISLSDVASGEHTVNEYIAQFDAPSLCLLMRGEGMSSPKAPVSGTASSFGGIMDVWNKSGMPVITTVDGPSGVRIAEGNGYSTCIPTGALLAAMWSPEKIYDVFDIFAKELRSYGLDIALAPGMNIHRHVLGGRNFEYFSEDPLLTGVNAAAVTKSFYDNGVRCTLKHFAVNSQELERGKENEVLSERALREIYLKGFEIAVKNGCVQYIMSSYNRINGISAASNYDLITTILRNEWGYDGVVMTDWWTTTDDLYNGTFSRCNLAAMVRAQNDLYMVTDDASVYPDDMSEALNEGRLTVGELQRCAKNIACAAIDSLSFKANRKSEITDVATGKLITRCDGAQCAGGIPSIGKYAVKITYSCSGDALAQKELFVISGGKTIQTLLIKGTDGKTDSRVFVAELTPDAVLSFKGAAQITQIEIYTIKR